MSEQGGLVPSEGVDEGSAEQVVEGLEERSGDRDVLGEPPRGGGPETAGPVDMESEESRAARAGRGTGQQLAEGEG